MARVTAVPKDQQLHSRDWLSKASAGLVLGYGMAMALTGLFAWFGAGTISPGKLQVSMWLVSPIWTLVLSLAFLFRTGPRAWMIMGLANILCFGLLFGGRLLFN